MAAPVRGARMLLYDDHGVRAEMTASWLAQMGWQSFVLEGVGPDDLEAGPRAAAGPEPPACDEITVSELVEASDASIMLLDLASSKQHSKGHVRGARFIMRGRLERDLPNSVIAAPIVVISPDDQLARHAIPQLIGLGCRGARVLKGGTQAWQAAGQAIETGMTDALSPADDVYRRPYEGLGSPHEKMQAYLDWEYGLVAQLKRDGSHGFYVV
jgi:rhodanese-related sulfurtransferase